MASGLSVMQWKIGSMELGGLSVRNLKPMSVSTLKLRW